MTTLVRVAHSPDSDDAFMFHGLSSGAVRAEGLELVHELHDLETLNRAAAEGRYEITALSVHAYAHLADRYLLLESGACFGDGYGPTVVVPRDSPARTLEALRGQRIAVPGRWTSAALALSMRLPDHQPVAVPFQEVLDAALRGEVAGALVIHEAQLAAEERGLRLVEDLGASWKERTGLPLPLGMNGVRKDLPEPLRRTLARALRDSIAWGLDHREQALDRAMAFARGLDRGRADRFVGMYVNEWTRHLGARGKEAVERFLSEAAARGLVPPVRVEYQPA